MDISSEWISIEPNPLEIYKITLLLIKADKVGDLNVQRYNIKNLLDLLENF